MSGEEWWLEAMKPRPGESARWVRWWRRAERRVRSGGEIMTAHTKRRGRGVLRRREERAWAIGLNPDRRPLLHNGRKWRG